VSHPSAAQPATELAGLLASAWAQAAAACARSQELQQWTTHVLTKARAARLTGAEARHRRRSSPAGRDLMQQSEYARLLARLESMPVIEQAKGIIMAQSHCGEAQAFDLLRRASQRSNVPVRELAAQIVAKTAQVSPKPSSKGRQHPVRTSGTTLRSSRQRPPLLAAFGRTEQSTRRPAARPVPSNTPLRPWIPTR
jgi:ANTAR domain